MQERWGGGMGDWMACCVSGNVLNLSVGLLHFEPSCYCEQPIAVTQLRLPSTPSLVFAGIAQWLERRTRDWKVSGSNPCWSGGRIFFSRVDFLCWLLFRYPFHPRVNAYTLRVWLCMKWYGAWLYGVHRTCAETDAVSCSTSHASAVSTPLRWIFKKRAIKLVTHVEPHASAVSLLRGDDELMLNVLRCHLTY